MKKPQWITAGIALLLTFSLYAVTQNNIFGVKQRTAAPKSATDHADHAHLSFDTILHHAKEALKPEQVQRIAFLENSITRGDVPAQKLKVYHQLAHFWADTANQLLPYAWYTAEAARLENSEKSLTFAARLFLNNLKQQESPELKHWMAEQAKDLFDRSLTLNPGNDSAQVGLGATYLFGGLSNPMEGISKIRTVVEKDSTNVYAQMTLGEASMISSQFDKAIERFAKVVRLQPNNLEANLLLAETYERTGKKVEAVTWYKKSAGLTEIPQLKEAVNQKINVL
ncbi:MAG TPA: tetratricopeptide repeat protein, partial [Chitinophagaceae bacterium]|nr:tetratricopeptide repeat protein [Chitinophagaceae bacterium]